MKKLTKIFLGLAMAGILGFLAINGHAPQIAHQDQGFVVAVVTEPHNQ